jgi:acetolactate synthase-1/2/3 large subunit
MQRFEIIADLFCHHDVEVCFALLGDANMHWAGAMHERGIKFIYTRHEHGAVAASAAYTRSSGKIGCASVTCGPGLTQIMTILPIAVRANIPIVIFAGEAPLSKPWYNQMIDQVPFVEACGAKYFALHDPDTIVEQINNAFRHASESWSPVVIGAPFDLQKQLHHDQQKFMPPRSLVLETGSDVICPNEISMAAEKIAAAQRPIIIAGLGVVKSRAKDDCVALAKKTGALLSTTLPAKGLFHDQPFCLGVAGGYATEKAKTIFSKSDLVIGIGARLASHSFDGGQLTPDALVVHLDVAPQTYVQGRHAADLLVKADAKHGANALIKALDQKTGWRTEKMRQATSDALVLPDDRDTPDGLLHPMAVIKQLAVTVPATCHIVNTSGHCAYYAAQMNKHPQSHYTVIREFGAIGNGTSFAIGVATAFPDRQVILIDGDGSLLMNVQELETIKRHNLNILIICLNDGAYGSEIHKLRADSAPLAGSLFGRTDFAALAEGFGISGKRLTNLATMRDLFEEYQRSSAPTVWDVPISDLIASPVMKKAHPA